jgi:hypothetical protein
MCKIVHVREDKKPHADSLRALTLLPPFWVEDMPMKLESWGPRCPSTSLFFRCVY